MVRPSIFFCASSMVASRAITLTKVSLVFLKPSSRRSLTLPPICSRRPSTVLDNPSMLLRRCCVALLNASWISFWSARPCSASFSSVCASISLRSASCLACSTLMASRVARSSSLTAARKRSASATCAAISRSPCLFRPSCKSVSMARCCCSSICAARAGALHCIADSTTSSTSTATSRRTSNVISLASSYLVLNASFISAMPLLHESLSAAAL